MLTNNFADGKKPKERVMGKHPLLPKKLFPLIMLILFVLFSASAYAACTDVDGDGYGSPGDISCPKGKLTDCNDNDNKVYPGAPKICDGKDNNCDGRLD
ncbi:MAG: putative metal-binding motif-containing protein, partial [Nitrospirae bacterium]|nr:putative metal-binding motif-containing protein [Nitrospirota bacterium]